MIDPNAANDNTNAFRDFIPEGEDNGAYANGSFSDFVPDTDTVPAAEMPEGVDPSVDPTTDPVAAQAPAVEEVDPTPAQTAKKPSKLAEAVTPEPVVTEAPVVQAPAAEVAQAEAVADAVIEGMEETTAVETATEPVPAAVVEEEIIEEEIVG